MTNNSTHTREHQSALIRQAQSGSIEARNQLIEENIGLIYTAIHECRIPRSQHDEHVFAATLAFNRCVKSFDPSKGRAFSTYAVPSMVREIYRQHNESAGSIKVPEDRAKHSESVKEAISTARKAGKLHGGIPAQSPQESPQAELQAVLWDWVDSFPEPHKHVATLTLKGHSVPQIAAATGLTFSQASYIRKDALQALKTRAAHSIYAA